MDESPIFSLQCNTMSSKHDENYENDEEMDYALTYQQIYVINQKT